MRVCHIWHNFYPVESGGVERYILCLSDFLSNQNQDVNFLMVTDKAAYLPFFRAIRLSRCQKIGSLEVHRLGPNLSSFLIGVNNRLFHNSSKTLDRNLTSALFNEAVNIKGMDKVDVFHVHGIWKPLYPTVGVLLSQHFKRPIVVTLHGDSVDPENPYAMPLRDQAIIDILEHAQTITSFSKEAINVLREVGLAEKSQLVPNFVDREYFKRPASITCGSFKSRILMVTRLSKGKAPLASISAFAEVVKQVPQATFKIVGYGPLYEDAKRLISELNLEGKVTLLGLKSDVRTFLWDSDIFIGTRGSYMTTLEAWSAGLAVVAPQLGIMRDLISNGEDGLLVPPDSIDGLTTALLTLIKDKNLRTKITINGFKKSEDYDVKTVAQRIANVYRDAMTNFDLEKN
jgi:glycosyltransferase involved in cell wall biosynthesis